ncbi:hypothetical protein Scep_009198 [Stephania cephalantha]|uniref:Uncharacterized protein n=1 Tax=Stephania cephalantha TaxID=152367 RepID=A0AAP0JV45_9MAGN
MELLVSTAFNVILVNLSHGSASTFLPLRSAPPSSLHNRLIIAMINERNIHWVRVKLRVNAPLPSLYPSWDRYVEDLRQRLARWIRISRHRAHCNC